MGHVDATLRVLDPESEPEASQQAHRKRVKLFRQGELGRMIVGMLRDADQPLSTSQSITSQIIRTGGHGEPQGAH